MSRLLKIQLKIISNYYVRARKLFRSRILGKKSKQVFGAGASFLRPFLAEQENYERPTNQQRDKKFTGTYVIIQNNFELNLQQPRHLFGSVTSISDLMSGSAKKGRSQLALVPEPEPSLKISLQLKPERFLRTKWDRSQPPFKYLEQEPFYN